MCEGQRLDREKCPRAARLQPHCLLRSKDRLVGPVEVHQNQSAEAECPGGIRIKDDRAIDRAQCGFVFTRKKCEGKTGIRKYNSGNTRLIWAGPVAASALPSARGAGNRRGD